MARREKLRNRKLQDKTDREHRRLVKAVNAFLRVSAITDGSGVEGGGGAWGGGADLGRGVGANLERGAVDMEQT